MMVSLPCGGGMPGARLLTAHVHAPNAGVLENLSQRNWQAEQTRPRCQVIAGPPRLWTPILR